MGLNCEPYYPCVPPHPSHQVHTPPRQPPKKAAEMSENEREFQKNPTAPTTRPSMRHSAAAQFIPGPKLALSEVLGRGEWTGNAIFHVGDTTDLPFEDGFFDVAHCHAVLMSVPDTSAVLAEVKRVLKPGGVIGCRELICGSCFTHPDFGVLRRSWDMFDDLLASDDGHPQMGKDLKASLLKAGFNNVRATASIEVYSAQEDIEFIQTVAMGWLLSPEIMEAAVKYGAATEELCNGIRHAYDKWREHSGAILGIAFGEAVANKPVS